MAPVEDEEVNPYELLGITIEATEGDIKSAYRKLSLKVHPDRVSFHISASTSIFDRHRESASE
jgi:curved DNA-binding protein CbpA